jgi:DegV family protein with EDD domain
MPSLFRRIHSASSTRNALSEAVTCFSPFAVSILAIIVTAVLYPVWGYFYDRYVRNKLLASLIWGSTTWLNAIAPNYGLFLVTPSSTGIDDSSYPGLYSLLSDCFGPWLRGKVYGLMQMSGPLGFMVGTWLAAQWKAESDQSGYCVQQTGALCRSLACAIIWQSGRKQLQIQKKEEGAMPSVAIITDTDASLPAEVAERYGIRQVPILIHFGQETLKTGEEIDDATLFARVDQEGQLPTTSAPSPGQFAEAYEAALSAGAEQIVCFCVSGAISATHGAAVVARDLFPDQDISVVDTRTLAMAQGFVVLAAAEAAQEGAAVAEILARARDVGERTHLYAALATLKYLAMSGRVGHLAAGMASILNVKPILTVRDGELDLLERVRTQKRAWARVIDLMAQALGDGTAERMAILHIAVPEQARQFEAQVRASLRCPEEILLAEMSPGLSVHGGTGMVGVVAVAR